MEYWIHSKKFHRFRHLDLFTKLKNNTRGYRFVPMWCANVNTFAVRRTDIAIIRIIICSDRKWPSH